MSECAGNERALRDGLRAMRPRSVVVRLGLRGNVSLPSNSVVGKERSIGGPFRFHAEIGLAVKLIDEGRVDASPFITGSTPMANAVTALRLAADRKRAMKVLIDFESAEIRPGRSAGRAPRRTSADSRAVEGAESAFRLGVC